MRQILPHDSSFPTTVSISGVWVRSVVPHGIEVLVEIDEQWHLVITEDTEHPTISHICEVGDILRAPVDQLTFDQLTN